MENLEKKTRDELRVLAKELAIAGRGRMTKAQLLDAVVAALHQQEAPAEGEQVYAEGLDKAAAKLQYVETAEVGTLVAFRLPDGRVKSAKIERRSTKRRVFKLVTQYGAEFTVPYEDVIWVRTGSRWPRGVYELLKGTAKVVDER